jgi:tyrosine-protein kinase Etk/Wzc
MSVPAVGVSSLLLRLSKYRWLLIAMPLLIGVSVGISSYRSLPIFTAYARLLPPQTNTATASSLLNQIGGTAVLGASALTIKNPSDLYASLFFSRTVQENVISQFGLAKHYGVEDIDDLCALVGKRTKVEVGRDGIITLAYTDKSSESAAAIANGMIEAMYKIARLLARGESERRIEFYDNLIVEARQTLKDSNAKLLETEKLLGLTRLKGQEEASVATALELRGLIATREVELRKMALVATAQHPEVIRMEAELYGLRSQLTTLFRIKRDVETTGSNKKSSFPKDSFFIPLEQYADFRAKVEPLRREVEISSNVLEQLIKARALSRVDESRDFSVISILDPAVAPRKKSGPRVFVNAAAGFAIGFLLAVIFALAWDILFTDQSRRERWHKVFQAFLRFKFRSKTSAVM